MREQMAVDVERGLDRRMPQPQLDHVEIPAGVDQIRNLRMTQIVKPRPLMQAPQTTAGRHRLPATADWRVLHTATCGGDSRLPEPIPQIALIPRATLRSRKHQL